MFTTEHFIWIGLCAAFVAGMSVIGVKRKFSLRRAGMIMTVLCAFSEVSKVLGGMLESPGGGMHLDPLNLPLHLCSLMLFAVLYLTFGKEGRFRQLLANFTAVMGTLGSFFAILIPTNGTDFTTLPAYQCFVYHGGLMWFSFYLIFSGQAQLGSLRSFLGNLGLLAALAFGMLYVNGALSIYDTNFFLSDPAAHGGAALPQSGPRMVRLLFPAAGAGNSAGGVVPPAVLGEKPWEKAVIPGQKRCG